MLEVWRWEGLGEEGPFGRGRKGEVGGGVWFHRMVAEGGW